MRLRAVPVFAAITAAIVLAFALVAVFVLRGLDLDAYRPQIIAQVERATGRSLAIGEHLQLGFRRGLVIRARDLVLGNSDWGSQPYLLRIGTAEARLALLPLLNGEIRLRHIDLSQADLQLETDASGRSNWQFGSDSGDAGGDGTNLTFESVTIEAGSITWHDARRDATALTLGIGGLDVRDDGKTLSLQADVQLADQPLHLRGRLTSPRRWHSTAARDLDLALESAIGNVDARGVFGPATADAGPAFEISASRLQLAKLARLAGHELPELPALTADLSLTRADGTWMVKVRSAAWGESTLRGSARWSADGQRPTLVADVTVDRLDLDAVHARRGRGSTPEPSAPWPLSPASTDLHPLRQLDLTLQLRTARLLTSGQTLRDVRLDAGLAAGRLRTQLTATTDGEGRVETATTLDLRGQTPRWTTQLALRQVPVGLLLGPSASLVQAPADLTLNLATRGASPRAMVGALSGNARLVVGPGRIRVKKIDALVGGLSTVAGQLFEQGSTDTALNCMVGDFAIEKGIATSRVTLIDSAAATLRADGTADLGKGQLDLTFTPRPKKPTLTVAVPVHVRGPMLAPQVQPDRTASLTKLIGVAGIFVYPPAAVAALGDLGTSGNPCAALLQGGSIAAPEASAAQRVREGVDDAVDSVGQGLKRLFGQ